MGVGKAALFAGTEIYNESLIQVLTSNHKSERNLSSVSPSFIFPQLGLELTYKVAFSDEDVLVPLKHASVSYKTT